LKAVIFYISSGSLRHLELLHPTVDSLMSASLCIKASEGRILVASKSFLDELVSGIETSLLSYVIKGSSYSQILDYPVIQID
jgi:hypothetical protein